MATAKEFFDKRDELTAFLEDHIHSYINDSITYTDIEALAEELIREDWVSFSD